jgi:mannose-6-phosphate isomerase-like protein (cupin superfamily)
MSIFPKRTVRGGTVTIHWNVNPPVGLDKPLCPFVRIGVIDPGGQTHVLFEEHVLLLPAAAPHLPKNTALLVLASYLAGQQSREKLIDILNNLQTGRHYYFAWKAPDDALPGKYKLLSEMYLEGSLLGSTTAAEDFFYVDQITIADDAQGNVTIHNPGPEAVPVKLISYSPQHHHQPDTLEVFNLAAGQERQITIEDKSVFLLYSEERITVPLHALHQPRALRNQQMLSITKQEVLYALPRTGNDAYSLTGLQAALWQAADGINTAASLRAIDNTVYNDLLTHRLITEIS